jgi:dUTP pyrophosphatase
MQLIIEKTHPEAKLPTRAHATDAGLDLYASTVQIIPAHTWQLIPTGIKMALPTDSVGLIWDKSGLASKGLHCLAGVIDADYRGEVLVNVYNLSDQDYQVEAGQKIAQLLIQAVHKPEIIEGSLDTTNRGEGGFGSTGLY